MARTVQGSLCCPCGKDRILALGLCSTCYTLRRQDDEYFGGHREEVLARDGYRCTVPGCTTLKRGKRSVAVHHRKPGISDPKLMLTLCLACHAKISRTQFVQKDWPQFLRTLWREQHPEGHEQIRIDFNKKGPASKTAALFAESPRTSET